MQTIKQEPCATCGSFTCEHPPASHFCDTHGEGFETVCPRCAMWKANILDQDAQAITKTPAAIDPEALGIPKVTPRPPAFSTSALQVQEGGNHYKKLKIQPVEYIHANGLQFAEGSIIKYVTRWRDKNGVADLKKARHFIDLLIELEAAK